MVDIVNRIHALNPACKVVVGTTSNFATFLPRRSFTIAYAAGLPAVVAGLPNTYVARIPSSADLLAAPPREIPRRTFPRALDSQRETGWGCGRPGKCQSRRYGSAPQMRMPFR